MTSFQKRCIEGHIFVSVCVESSKFLQGWVIEQAIKSNQTMKDLKSMNRC